MGDEILLKGDSKIIETHNIKENYIVVIKDLEHKEVFDNVDVLDEGEVKLVFVYENDIQNFEGGVDQVIKIQELTIPFDDIGEESITCPNLVESNKGFLFCTNNPIVTEEPDSINGVIYSGFDKIYVEMNKATEAYTFTMRYIAKPFDSTPAISGADLEYLTLLDTGNVFVEYNDLEMRVTVNGETRTIAVVNPEDDFMHLSVVYTKVNGKHIFHVCISDNTSPLVRYNETFMFDVDSWTDYVQDAVAFINVNAIDYLTIQNRALSINATFNLHRALRREIIKETETAEQDIFGYDFNNYIASVQQQDLDKSVFALPADIELAPNDYLGVADDTNKTFWVCPNNVFYGRKAEKINVFVEENATYLNGDSPKGNIYAKAGSKIDLNGASNYVVYYEDGVDIINYSASILIKARQIVFDYTAVPASLDGCEDARTFVPLPVLSFPFLPADNYTKVTATCVSGLDISNDNRFEVDGNTLLDRLQNLYWQRKPEFLQQDSANKQNEAFKGARTSEVEDYDWRLPTRNEFESLETSFATNPATSGMSFLHAMTATGYFDTSMFALTGNVATSGAYTAWTSTPEIGTHQTGSGDFYAYDTTASIEMLLDTLSNNAHMGIYVTEADTRLKVTYEDGDEFVLPINDGEVLEIEKEGVPTLTRNQGDFEYDNYTLGFSMEKSLDEQRLSYGNHHKLNNSYKYLFGKYFSTDIENSEEMGNTVLPIFINGDDKITQSIFVEPENHVRVTENLSQRYSPKPFIINFDNVSNGVTIWTNFGAYVDRIAFQYNLSENDLLTPTYQKYDTLSSQAYSEDEYYCAYHFDVTDDQRRVLINTVKGEISGEIFLGGRTVNNTYLREIKNFRFFDVPKKYKTSLIDVELDLKDKKDLDSYINNYDYIRNFVEDVVKLWKPATININKITEKETLVMSELIKEEYTQVLIGLTARENVNTYYLRSADNENVSVLSSSLNFSDNIDWLGVGRLNTPYVKSGVTKVKKAAKNIKVNFESRFTNKVYRVFVFSPSNTKYYVTQKDNDGFIVESASLVEDEVAWIALNTDQIINGSVYWREGVPEQAVIDSEFDRVNEVVENMNRYKLDFTEFGYPAFDNTNYSVILSANKNVNMWVDSKDTKSVVVRRSYAGEPITFDFMIVSGSSRWWQEITG